MNQSLRISCVPEGGSKRVGENESETRTGGRSMRNRVNVMVVMEDQMAIRTEQVMTRDVSTGEVADYGDGQVGRVIR